MAVERKSQLAIILKSRQQTGRYYTKIINALAPYKQLVHAIAADIGKEFTNHHQHIAQKLQAGYFFAHPYSSWQTGLNEYTYKLFRQYLLKKLSHPILLRHPKQT